MNYKTDKKAAIFMADGCEEIEALTVVDILYRAGIPLTKVSISDSLSVTSSHEVTFLTDTTVSLLDFDEYDMLILPGGMPGTIHLDACQTDRRHLRGPLGLRKTGPAAGQKSHLQPFQGRCSQRRRRHPDL